METQTTYSGVPALGDVSWGSHFCTFFNSTDDLLGIMTSFFKSGLQNNEMCLWAVSPPVSPAQALLSLEGVLPDLELYLDKKQLTIIPYDEWYFENGRFDAAKTFQRWQLSYDKALQAGFSGMRANGMESWIDENQWQAFMKYEDDLNTFMADKKIIVQCTYPLKQSNASNLLDVAHVHEKVIAKREGQWRVLEEQEMRQSKARLFETNEMLEKLVRERTRNLENSIARIEAEVATRARTEKKLVKIARDLEKRNADLRQFAYIVSHNLRGPITNIIGIGLLLDAATDEIRLDLQKALLEAIGQLDSVVRDLNVILQVRFEPSDGNEMVNFDELVDIVRSGLLFEVQKSGATIETDFGEISGMFTVRAYLYSIFQNLISNSIKYAHGDRTPYIKIKSRLACKKLQLVFADNGSGIDLEKHAGDVFGLYKRFTKRGSGKGLGLFMVREQVESLGGEVSVKSVPGDGTVFTLEFPVLGDVI
ncbi:MEDS domain-containing protein [Flavobacterium sp.]|uniref:MEDS domain-containing protein n=1 Tax=Flavobacterium sp. TaxID=239 RepID=UPI0025BB584E|nr:MEDS domain-containing protein [Flavobacterium sp.]